MRRAVSDSSGKSEKDDDQIRTRSFVPDAGRAGAKHDQPDNIENQKALRAPRLAEEIRKGGIKPGEVLFAKMHDEQADTQHIWPYQPPSCRQPMSFPPNKVRGDEAYAQTAGREPQKESVESDTSSDYRDPNQRRSSDGFFQVSVQESSRK